MDEIDYSDQSGCSQEEMQDIQEVLHYSKKTARIVLVPIFGFLILLGVLAEVIRGCASA